jgi:hypothetical protein
MVCARWSGVVGQGRWRTELLCCGEVVGCRRKEVGGREKAFVGEVARPITSPTIAATAYHGSNEGGGANEEEDVMEVVRVNNQVVPRMRTVQGGAGWSSSE